MKTIEQALTDNSFHQAHNIGCDFCVTPDHYKTAHFTTLKNGKQICNYCKNHVRKQFKGRRKNWCHGQWWQRWIICMDDTM